MLFFPLFSKVFTDILKTYERLKVLNKIPKYSQTLILTIINYTANCIPQLHVAFELNPNSKCALGQKRFFWH